MVSSPWNMKVNFYRLSMIISSHWVQDSYPKYQPGITLRRFVACICMYFLALSPVLSIWQFQMESCLSQHRRLQEGTTDGQTWWSIKMIEAIQYHCYRMSCSYVKYHIIKHYLHLSKPSKNIRISCKPTNSDHGSTWAGLGWSQMGNTLQWKITLLFFWRKRHMRISGFNILLS